LEIKTYCIKTSFRIICGTKKNRNFVTWIVFERKVSATL